MSRLDRIANWKELAQRSRYGATELAKVCQVSYSQLRRYFAGAFGKSPQAFLDELRLDEAANLISSTSLMIKEISRELHFSGDSQFCRRFKAPFGCRPSEFPLRNRDGGTSTPQPQKLHKAADPCVVPPRS